MSENWSRPEKLLAYSASKESSHLNKKENFKEMLVSLMKGNMV